MTINNPSGIERRCQKQRVLNAMCAMHGLNVSDSHRLIRNLKQENNTKHTINNNVICITAKWYNDMIIVTF